jgi:hypothetical protein
VNYFQNTRVLGNGWSNENRKRIQTFKLEWAGRNS